MLVTLFSILCNIFFTKNSFLKMKGFYVVSHDTLIFTCHQKFRLNSFTLERQKDTLLPHSLPKSAFARNTICFLQGLGFFKKCQTNC